MVLTNRQYQDLRYKYEERQLKTKYLLSQRTNEIYEKIPKIRDLDNELRSLSLEYAKKSLLKKKENNLNSSQEYQNKIDKISQEKEKLLFENGYDKDYLSPVYECDDCKDTGYIGDKKCHCFEKLIVSYLYQMSNIEDKLEKENFEHYNIEFYPDDYIDEATEMTPRESMKKNLNKIKDFIDKFDQEHQNILLYGSTGTGKTFLTNCIAKELLDRSHSVVYLTSIKLFDILETQKFNQNQLYEESDGLAPYILQSELLIIDDLGTELSNSFTISQLYYCIDYRYNNNKSTIISTNLSFEDLREKYSERTLSRIVSNYKMLKLTGDDIRMKKALDKIKS